MLGELARQSQAIRDLDSEVRGQCVIASLMSISRHVVPAAPVAFRRRHPKMHADQSVCAIHSIFDLCSHLISSRRCQGETSDHSAASRILKSPNGLGADEMNSVLIAAIDRAAVGVGHIDRCVQLASVGIGEVKANSI